VRLDRVWLTDVRSYASADISLAPGLTALLGDNGQGKTNVLEAIAWLATLSSFRGAPTEALIRRGVDRAVIRAEGEREGRSILIEAELVASGRNRVLVNRQPLKRARDLLGVLRVTVFAPDDLDLVKGGPAERRRYLDDALVASHPRYDALRSEVDKVLKQRNALLKNAGGRLDESAAFTLDVWDAKLVEAGGADGAVADLEDELRGGLRRQAAGAREQGLTGREVGQEGVAAVGVELGEDVVEQQHGGRARHVRDHVVGRQAQGQGQRPLLALGRVRAGRQPADGQVDVVAVRAYQGHASLELVPPPRHIGEFRSLRGERLRARETEPRGGAADDRRPPFQSQVHVGGTLATRGGARCRESRAVP
jgi:hypothetical protein